VTECTTAVQLAPIPGGSKWWIVTWNPEHQRFSREPVAAWALLDCGAVVALVAGDGGRLVPVDPDEGQLEEEDRLKELAGCDCRRQDLREADGWCRSCGSYP